MIFVGRIERSIQIKASSSTDCSVQRQSKLFDRKHGCTAKRSTRSQGNGRLFTIASIHPPQSNSESKTNTSKETKYGNWSFFF